jgi:hypothetical protein
LINKIQMSEPRVIIRSFIIVFLLIASIQQAQAQDPATAAIAAEAARVAMEEGLADCAFVLGGNQCRNLARCNRTRNVIKRADLDEIQRFRNASRHQNNCFRALDSGRLGALLDQLEQANKQ